MERAVAALARAQRKAAERRAQVEARAAAAGRKPGGPPPIKSRDEAKAEERLRRAETAQASRALPLTVKDQPRPPPTRTAARTKPPGWDQPNANVTDPDSRIMKSPGGWVQGYNAQAAVNTNGVVLAAAVTAQHNDMGQCQPMMAATAAALHAAGITEPVGIVLFDAGYCSYDNLTAPGPDRLIATTKTWKQHRTAASDGWASGNPPPDATPLQAMDHRLRTENGARLYGLRQHTVEPVFGHTKANRGFRSFLRRGLSAVDAEWQLITATHNLTKLHRTGYQPGHTP